MSIEINIVGCHKEHLAYLAQRLTPARLQHSLGVTQVMETLAPIYGLDLTAARLAGLAHDAGKELPQVRMAAMAQAQGFTLAGPDDHDPLYLHGPASAYVAQHEMGIHDPLVLEAIFRHSYVGEGRVQSPVFCWCLRFADMLEPGRDWQTARDQLQPLIFTGRLGAAAHAMLEWLVPFLEGLGITAHPAQRVLRSKLKQLFANGAKGVPNDQVPV